MPPIFTLVAVCTEDGFIASHEGHTPADWASAEEQAVFLAEVEAADWSIMGRGTHEAADRPDRRRIVLSTAPLAPDWRGPTQLWVDPAPIGPDGLAPLVEHVRPMRNALILGGTQVYDWFHAAGRIDRVLLTIEPVAFGVGLPLFTGQKGPADRTLEKLGYRLDSTRPLNARGTRLLSFV